MQLDNLLQYVGHSYKKANKIYKVNYVNMKKRYETLHFFHKRKFCRYYYSIIFFRGKMGTTFDHGNLKVEQLIYCTIK